MVQTGTGAGTQTAILVGNAPGSYANGSGTNLAVEDRIGDAPESTANSVSINMIPSNRHSYPAGYVPTQVDNAFSMDFDGTNDYVDLGNLSSIGISNASAASVSMWFKKDGNGNYILFELKEGASRVAIQSYLSNSLYIYINGVSYNVATTVANNEWHNIILAFDGTGASNADRLKLYFNGSNITGGTYSGTVPTAVGAFTSSMTSNLGRTPTTAYFDGKIDEAAIFNYALSARQVKQDIYEGTTAGGKTADLNNISNLTAPVAWYRMGD